jgi:DIS3-like exonuclease 1
MVEHDIVSIPFTPSMLADLPHHSDAQPWQPDPAELLKRRDIRAWRTMSIDPIGCEDIDDALSVEVLSSNKVRVGVHIADVSHFVAKGTPLDMEAQARATSVYFVDRRIDMLPAVLSATVCSLREKVDRYAVSAICDFDRDTGNLLFCFLFF